MRIFTTEVNSVLASIQLGKFFLVIFTAIVSHHTKFDFKIIAKKYRKNLDDRLALNYLNSSRAFPASDQRRPSQRKTDPIQLYFLSRLSMIVPVNEVTDVSTTCTVVIFRVKVS